MANRVLAKGTGTDLGERAQHILRLLVERYIREGQPVGSRTLTRDPSVDLSPATVRNVMADLEELGYVVAPHTSAGRVPTPLGYRFFVDALLQVQPVGDSELGPLREAVSPGRSTVDVAESLSGILSTLTHMVGMVMLPRRQRQVLRQVEFLPLSKRRVLVILVLNEQEVQNRIIQVDADYSAAELQQVGNFLTAHFAGMPLQKVRDRLQAELEVERGEIRRILAAAEALSGQVFQDVSSAADYVLAGQTNLMEFEELSDLERLREKFEVLNRKQEILRLLDKCLDAEGLQIFIGEESGFHALSDCSVVTSAYSLQGEPVGVIGVIGPTRMSYGEVIPIVDVSARMLSAALNMRR